MGVAAPRLE
uniref:Uncharacterized protein n=1 Tax=Arundo donax TaxID=35708 RepID=A0A0A8YPE1_ARUDO